MTSRGDALLQASRGSEDVMRLAVALAGSLALHAATLALPGGHWGTLAGGTFRPPTPVSLAVTFSPAVNASPQTVVRQDDTPAAVVNERDQPSAPPAPGGDAGVGLVPAYFPADALTRMPEALTDFEPLIPERQMAPPEGRAELRVWLSRDGRVDKIEVLKTDVPPVMTAAAIDAFQRMRFRPAEIRGAPVGSWTDVIVGFEAPPITQPQAR